jgi:hypothetical protein
MQPYAAEGKTAFLNLTNWRAVRIPSDDVGTIEEITDPAEYEPACAAYSARNANRLMRLGLEEAEEARRAAHAANEDAQRRQAEERATVRLKEKEEAIRRYRIADLQPEHCSFRAFRPSTGGERALLSVATAHDSAATVQSFFDVGMNEIVLLEEGSLGPSIRHGKRFTNAIECFREWQGRERALETARLRKEYIAKARAKLSELADKLVDAPPSVTAPADVLDADSTDLWLAIEWSERRHRAELRELRENAPDVRSFEAALRRHLQDNLPPSHYELSRTLSARIAEKAAKWFYEQHFGAGSVKDIAREQARRRPNSRSGSSDLGWHTHDLAVNAGERLIPVDVKNARANYAPPQEYKRRRASSDAMSLPYTEHCVPQFKKARGDKDVVIAGVYSTYRTPLELLSQEYDENNAPQFLGEVDPNSIEWLVREFNSEVLQIDLRASSRFGSGGFFLPPWMFDYPTWVYQSRYKILDEVRTTVFECRELLDEQDSQLWPLYVEAGVLESSSPIVAGLEDLWKQFFQDLNQCTTNERRSLPVLYLTVLRHFLLTLAGAHAGNSAEGESTPVHFNPAKYRSFLYIRNALDQPLGIYDPLKTVNSLITSLCALPRHNPRKLLEFRLFKFKQTGVLTARRNRDDQETTIMFPYCGGEKCGREGLVLGAGRTRNCQQCGHLICPNPWCGFCSRRPGCHKRQNRRKEWAARKQPDVEQHTPATASRAPLSEQPFADDDLPF